MSNIRGPNANAERAIETVDLAVDFIFTAVAFSSPLGLAASLTYWAVDEFVADGNFTWWAFSGAMDAIKPEEYGRSDDE